MALIPRPWRIEEDPGPWLASALADALPAPLLLRLDRDAPIPTATLEQLRTWLDAGERQRLLALRRPQDQRRFLLARAGLRRVLGAWRGEAPARVAVASDARGKPFCPGAPHFNLSHGGDLILLAFHPDWPVGVDVEPPRPRLAWRPVASRMLGSAELGRLERLPPQHQPEGFLRAWCRLEARLKARGTGLAGGEILRTTPLLGTADVRERLWPLQLPGGHCGAVACLVAPRSTGG